ncbi:17326_t:CDS:1, partial [Racocetra fulgida]
MVNATEWLNLNYPVNGTYQRIDDKENYGKTREQIINLDISNQDFESALVLNFNKLKK